MIEDIIKHYNIRYTHSNQVKSYSWMLFDALNKKLFDFHEKEKSYLCAAALLHDIGYHIERKSHHKHSLDMILSMDFKEFDAREREIVAHLARYHRSSFPDETKHKRFAQLDDEQKNIILKLSGLLRLADGLDKPSKNLITGIEANVDDTSINLILRIVGFMPKLAMAGQKKDLMEFIYKKPVNLFCKRL